MGWVIETTVEGRSQHLQIPLLGGVAGPLAAQGSGQISRPSILGFGNWRACLKYKSML